MSSLAPSLGSMGCKGSKQAASTEGATATPPESKTLKEEKPEGEISVAVAAAPTFDFKVVLEREASEGMGVRVDFFGSSVLKVNNIKDEGLIPAWNSKNENKPEVHIKVGDSIVDINGVHGDPKKMMEQIGAKVVTLLVQRPALAEEAAIEVAEKPALEPAAEPAVGENSKPEYSAEAKAEVPEAITDQFGEKRAEEITEPQSEEVAEMAPLVDTELTAEPEQPQSQQVVEDMQTADVQTTELALAFDSEVVPVEPEQAEVNNEAGKKMCAFCWA